MVSWIRGFWGNLVETLSGIIERIAIEKVKSSNKWSSQSRGMPLKTVLDQAISRKCFIIDEVPIFKEIV